MSLGHFQCGRSDVSIWNGGRRRRRGGGRGGGRSGRTSALCGCREQLEPLASLPVQHNERKPQSPGGAGSEARGAGSGRGQGPGNTWPLVAEGRAPFIEFLFFFVDINIIFSLAFSSRRLRRGGVALIGLIGFKSESP